MRLQVVLLTVASIAALASLQPVHSTFVFASYTNWARQCLGGPSDGVCGPSAAQFLDFTYSALTGAVSLAHIAPATICFKPHVTQIAVITCGSAGPGSHIITPHLRTP